MVKIVEIAKEQFALIGGVMVLKSLVVAIYWNEDWKRVGIRTTCRDDLVTSIGREEWDAYIQGLK
jgi:hypothetical protein